MEAVELTGVDRAAIAGFSKLLEGYWLDEQHIHRLAKLRRTDFDNLKVISVQVQVEEMPRRIAMMNCWTAKDSHSHQNILKDAFTFTRGVWGASQPVNHPGLASSLSRQFSCGSGR